MGSQAVRHAGAGWPGWRTVGAAFALLTAIARRTAWWRLQLRPRRGGPGRPGPENVPRTPAMEQACNAGAGPCQQAVVHAIDVARAAEGVGPLELPSYYDSLSVAEQTPGAHRPGKGGPGFDRLHRPVLEARCSVEGGRQFQPGPYGAGTTPPGDPTGLGERPRRCWRTMTGCTTTARIHQYGLQSATASGCWDHRRNILSNYGPHPAIGAAATTVAASLR